MEDLVLFDIAPPEKEGELQETEIEYLVIGFDQNKKRTMIKMLEDLCDENHIKVYAEYLFRIVKEKHEEIKKGIKLPPGAKKETTEKPSLEENIEAIDWKLWEIYNIIKEKDEEINSRL